MGKKRKRTSSETSSSAGPAGARGASLLGSGGSVSDCGPPAAPPARRRDEDEVLSAVSAVYRSVDGYGIARDAKREQRSSGVYLDGLQYGEVDPSSLARALDWVGPIREGEAFYDLGSGCGVAVLTAAALHPEFGRATGIEIVERLHDAAVAASRELLSCSPGGGDGSVLRLSKVHFVLGDALAAPWYEDAGVVFCYNTCFTDEMMARLRGGAERLQSGSRVLISGRPIESDELELLRRESLSCGKKAGKSTFFAYKRR